MIQLVIGGSGSGKSEYAEMTAMVNCNQYKEDASMIYLATMQNYDRECQNKIDRHRKQRAGKHFETVECAKDLHLLNLKPTSCILLECLSNLLANEMYREDVKQRKKDVVEEILLGIRHLSDTTKNLIIVSNQVFSDGEAYDPETMKYIEQLGKLLEEISRMDVCTRVTEVVFSIPIELKNTEQIRKTEENKNVGIL